MVARAFIGPRPDGMEINHKDCNFLNNALSNLEYCTPAENRAHANRMGKIRHGEAHEWAKLTEGRVREIRAAYDGGEGGYKALGLRFGMPWGTIRNIVKRRRWAYLP